LTKIENLLPSDWKSYAGERKMDFLKETLEKLKEEALLRTLRLVETEQGPEAIIDGKKVLMLCSNNYLGLASHPSLKEAAKKALEEWGCGAGASRLISGHMTIHEKLEHRLAQFYGKEASIVFSSGYMANVGIISSLMQKGDVILSDELNHASIIDGCRLSRAEVKIFPHKDLSKLEELLAAAKHESKKLIVLEGVFSMEGDVFPLEEVTKLAKKYEAMLMVDEAHATGVFGQGGRGTLEHFGLLQEADIIIMGTMGKAMGSFGAYVIGKKELREFLMNKARSFIFTTSLPPPVIASSLAAIDIIEEGSCLRKRLWENVEYLREGLLQMGYDLMNSQSHIIPLFIYDNIKCMEMSRRLFEKGIFVQGIRPPSVPEKKSRLRITLMATHTKEQLDRALEAFEEVGKDMGLIS